MKGIALALLVIVWLFISIGGFIFWETNTDMAQGLSIGVLITVGIVALLVNDKSEWKPMKYQKDYYIKW